MEVFEVHITGDESIIANATCLNLKTIQVELLRPDKTPLRTEHMTSHVFRFKDYAECKKHVDSVVERLRSLGTNIVRVKIESPYYPQYVKNSRYIESHFDDNSFKYPTSRNQRKESCLGTDREYDQGKYDSFRSKWKEVELCLYDSYVEEDFDWLNLWK